MVRKSTSSLQGEVKPLRELAQSQAFVRASYAANAVLSGF